MHFKQRAGRNSHHVIEATFKAFARALRQATEYDPRRRGSVPRSVQNVLNLFFFLLKNSAKNSLGFT